MWVRQGRLLLHTSRPQPSLTFLPIALSPLFLDQVPRPLLSSHSLLSLCLYLAPWTAFQFGWRPSFAWLAGVDKMRGQDMPVNSGIASRPTPGLACGELVHPFWKLAPSARSFPADQYQAPHRQLPPRFGQISGFCTLPPLSLTG